MPLPRYQPVKKKTKVSHGPTIDDLDDYCLSKIIGYALTFASLREDGQSSDNRKAEKNLSLVSKRWYFLTQAQVAFCGLCKINLDHLGDRFGSQNQIATRPYGTLSHIRGPSVLVQKNNNITCATLARPRAPNAIHQHLTTSKSSEYSINLYRLLLPKLRKYKNIQIDGTLACEEFRKLIVGLGAAQVEHLNLKLVIKNDKTSPKDFAIIPKQLGHLERLTFRWSIGKNCEFSNGLMWTIFYRASNLKTLEICLGEADMQNPELPHEDPSNTNAIERIANKYLEKASHLPHLCLEKLVFNRTLVPNQKAFDYSSLIRDVIGREDSLSYVDTNDRTLIDYLIESSNRICTKRDLKFLRFSSEIDDMNLLGKLLDNKSLGTEHLSLVVNELDQLSEISTKLESFYINRDRISSCYLSFNARDQKFSDPEVKIKYLAQISRMAQVTVNIICQQRVSIDCCHLMWSVGRSLQTNLGSQNNQASCVFKVLVQTNPAKASSLSEITIPFGTCHHYRINSSREDTLRHREIMKSLKRDCYHQFVKSVRDSVTPS